VSSDVVPVYYPGLRRKKKAMKIMSTMAVVATGWVSSYASCKIYTMMMIGTGFTQWGGGPSDFAQALI
jgi:hypothetical protein